MSHEPGRHLHQLVVSIIGNLSSPLRNKTPYHEIAISSINETSLSPEEPCANEGNSKLRITIREKTINH